MKNKYPIFIPSKGRWESRHTMKMFDRLGIDYTVVIEPQEFDKYSKVIPPEKLLCTPHTDAGLTTTRNWIWNYAESKGYEKFWSFDDNIFDLWRLHDNLNIKMETGTPIRVLEDFSDRYKNVGVVGMQYFMFVARKSKLPPYTVNSRVYSNMLMSCKQKNPDGSPFRHNLEFNDDTDINIRFLKMVLCTIQFNQFQIHKAPTMTVKGGNTASYDKMQRNRKAISQLIADAHPDVASVVWKFNRWHHEVDYKRFKHTLIRVDNYDEIVKKGVDNYGMVLTNTKKIK